MALPIFAADPARVLRCLNLPFKANAGRRHQSPKQRHRATNATAYDAALLQRGSLIVWFTDAAIAAWKAEPRTMRGGQPRYSRPGHRHQRSPRRQFQPSHSKQALRPVRADSRATRRTPRHTASEPRLHGSPPSPALIVRPFMAGCGSARRPFGDSRRATAYLIRSSHSLGGAGAGMPQRLSALA
jgi:hypothetical protein